ncbi:hypothetical protein A6R71_15690 [Xanthomonas translucens pv. arrhenatheri]|nr:hypothetical protein A6R71_15690 [Xanthomonas translucens pv. arrhenatheri]
MQRDEQHMVVVGQSQQLAACQRVVGQVEGRVGFLVGPRSGLCFRIGAGAEIMFGQRKTDAVGGDALHRFVVVQADAGTQGGVAGDEAVQRLTQRVTIQTATQTQTIGHQIGQPGLAVELGQEPQPLLGEGQRQRRAAIGRYDGRQRAGRSADHAACKGMQLRMVEHIPDLKFHAKSGAHPRDQLHCQQRVSTESEEVVVAPQLRQAEQFPPQRGQCLFDSTLWLLYFVDRRGGGERRYRQGAPIQLAVDGQRQGVQCHVGRWQHVLRQPCCQLGA